MRPFRLSGQGLYDYPPGGAGPGDPPGQGGGLRRGDRRLFREPVRKTGGDALGGDPHRRGHDPSGPGRGGSDRGADPQGAGGVPDLQNHHLRLQRGDSLRGQPGNHPGAQPCDPGDGGEQQSDAPEAGGGDPIFCGAVSGGGGHRPGGQRENLHLSPDPDHGFGGIYPCGGRPEGGGRGSQRVRYHEDTGDGG